MVLADSQDSRKDSTNQGITVEERPFKGRVRSKSARPSGPVSVFIDRSSTASSCRVPHVSRALFARESLP